MNSKEIAPTPDAGKSGDDRLIATIRKNSREELRITLSSWRDNDLINLRVWYDAGGGEMRPGKSGFALKVELLRDLAGAIGRALETARADGLVK